LREILDAVFYIARSGCQWRLLPHDFPPWKTVHHYLRTWRKDGTWERVHDLVQRPRKPAPEEVMMRWAKEWEREGVSVDLQKLRPPQGFVVLPRRWVVERTIAWIDQNRRMSLWITSG
jgi:transposase